ncbi:MAG: redox-regulated ATPase YchF [Nitrososphaeria archaeon]|nr:redox-regulated ATPase YchF [Nitrososphaeria archaeon]
MRVKIGLIGKTNTGKTTFFNSATLQSAEISTYPFTTKTPNLGVAHVVTLCVHKEFGVKDNPQNSICDDGWRFIPIELIDLPGLIRGAWMGKGLGNQFLSVAAQSDALIHVVDASGSVDAEGRICEPGTGDPVADIGDIEEELVMWYMKLILANQDRIERDIKRNMDLPTIINNFMQGVGVTKEHVIIALEKSGLMEKDFRNWSEEELKNFTWTLRDVSKPTLIVANKMDLPHAEENFERIREAYSDMIVIPTSAEAELTLRRAEQKGYIKYIPGEERFRVIDSSKMTDKQKWALNFIRKSILSKYLHTGVQFALNVVVFKLLRMSAVYPVYDPKSLTDKNGNILPDVHLMPYGATISDLAREVHTELAKGLLYGIDCRDGLRLPVTYKLKDRDVISLVSASSKKK